jgi:glycine cleavage system H protein
VRRGLLALGKLVEYNTSRAGCAARAVVSTKKGVATMKLDQGARYAESHEWVRWDEKEIVCGISDYAQESLSDVVYVELPEVGDILEKGEIFGVVESVKAASDLYMPMGGEIVAINEDLEDAPELVNQDPYGDGWLIRFVPSTSSEFDDLMTAGEYEALLTEEEEK